MSHRYFPKAAGPLLLLKMTFPVYSLFSRRYAGARASFSPIAHLSRCCSPGARNVYKNLFEPNRHVEFYKMDDFETELAISRELLVELAQVRASGTSRITVLVRQGCGWSFSI
eukprot:6185682-Pleurochrysis_carterae.AAC.1